MQTGGRVQQFSARRDQRRGRPCCSATRRSRGPRCRCRSLRRTAASVRARDKRPRRDWAGRTDGEGDDPVRELRGEAAVAVEDVAAEHVLRGALAEGGDGCVWRCEVLCSVRGGTGVP